MAQDNTEITRMNFFDNLYYEDIGSQPYLKNISFSNIIRNRRYTIYYNPIGISIEPISSSNVDLATNNIYNNVKTFSEITNLIVQNVPNYLNQNYISFVNLHADKLNNIINISFVKIMGLFKIEK